MPSRRTRRGRRGVAIVDDHVGDADLEALHGAGVRGVRFNFVRHLGDPPDLAVFRGVVDRIRHLGGHLVLHLDAADIVPLRALMVALPVPFVVDHMGRIESMLLEIARRETCWVKVCGSERISPPPHRAAVPFARALVAACASHVLWGTDFPHPNLDHVVDEADLVDLVGVFAPDPADRRRLLVDNPARLYGF